ncbi:MAG TPA: nucleotidyltransferase family protein [Acidimicrobiia bacterium]|nr:nucleotidyltransferase family protein [Acidimicrobiia bacterium]
MRPPKALIDLAAGRSLNGNIAADIVRSAEEHRLGGLLKTAMDQGLAVESDAAIELNRVDALGWARNRMLLDACNEIAGTAAQLGIDLFVIKGIANEARWYSRLGERPAWDIDLVLAPWHRNRVGDLLAALQPRHSLLSDPAELQSARLQSIDLGFHSLPVDLHLDPLKLEVAATRDAGILFENASSLLPATDQSVRVLGIEPSLVLAALHLNKDRFRYLLGYVDVVRILADSNLDLDRAVKIAEALGLGRSFRSTIAAAHVDLELSPPAEFELNDWMWNRTWPPSIRMLGTEGQDRFRYRQFFLPLLEGGRWSEVLIASWHRLFPSPYQLWRNFPNEKGSYLGRLIRGRIRHRLTRLQRRRQHRLIH